MKDEAHQQDKLALLAFWLIMPVVIAILTWLSFNVILHYYAPYGRAIAFPVAKLREPFELVTPVEVWDGTKVTQPFDGTVNGLGRIDFQVVAWGDRHRPHDVFWQLSEIGNDGTKILKRNGSFHASSVKDWEFVTLQFKPIVDSACRRYEISFFTFGTPQHESMGFPIFKIQQLPPLEAMPKIISGNSKDIKMYSEGSLRGLIYYFYERFG
jgi:hypothetical protein